MPLVLLLLPPVALVELVAPPLPAPHTQAP
jgi:hypothetical protein